METLTGISTSSALGATGPCSTTETVGSVSSTLLLGEVPIPTPGPGVRVAAANGMSPYAVDLLQKVQGTGEQIRKLHMQLKTSETAAKITALQVELLQYKVEYKAIPDDLKVTKNQLKKAKRLEAWDAKNLLLR